MEHSIKNPKVVEIKSCNTELLERFLLTITKSKNHFRYYETRSLESLKNHLVTLLLVVNTTPVAYGHLDIEEEKVWLGICVSDEYHGNGFGKKMMSCLFEYAIENNIEKINLSVDKNNNIAYNMYSKLGFLTYSENQKSFLMKKWFKI